MPLRSIPLVNNEIYHVVNRGVGAIPIFLNALNYKRFIKTFRYYHYQNQPIRYSKYVDYSYLNKKILTKFHKPNNFLVEILAFCLMPNHYHFLLKQLVDNGISDFIRLSSNSYSKYHNIKFKRKGPLFEGRFKAIRIETDEQLLHVNRYIHLNPYTSFLIKDIRDLFSYQYSSLPEYLGLNSTNTCQKEYVLSHFKTIKDYKKFIMEQADYQQSLELIKHQLLEEE